MVEIIGSGFFESKDKQCKIILPNGGSFKVNPFRNIHNYHKIELKWSYQQNQFSFMMPPAKWLLGDVIESESALEVQKIVQNPIQIQITLDSVEWTTIGFFNYYGTFFPLKSLNIFRSKNRENFAS